MSGIHLYFIDKWRLKCEQGNTLFLRGKAINQNHISKTNIREKKWNFRENNKGSWYIFENCK